MSWLQGKRKVLEMRKTELDGQVTLINQPSLVIHIKHKGVKTYYSYIYIAQWGWILLRSLEVGWFWIR
jgi:hypothetical protein